MTEPEALAWYLRGAWIMDPPDVVAYNLGRLEQTHPACAAVVRRWLERAGR